MAFDQELAARIRRTLRRRKGVMEKKMFGGIGFLLNGNMCVGVWKDSLVVRFDKESHDDVLSQEHVDVFDITGRVMKGWALVGAAAIESNEALKQWIDRSVKFVRSLPAK